MHTLVKTQNRSIFTIENANLKNLVSRSISVLTMSMCAQGVSAQERYERILGYAHAYSPIYLKQGILYDFNQLEDEKKKLIQLSENDSELFLKFAKLCEEKGNSIMSYSFKIKELDPAKIDSKELEACFNKLYGELLDFMVFLLMPISIQKYLEDKLVSELKKCGLTENVEQYSTILTSPNKNNTSYEEQKSILELSILYKKNVHVYELMKKIRQHLFNYSQVGIKYGIGKLWTEETILERIEFLSEQNPEAKLNYLENQTSSRNSAVEKIIEELKLKKETIQLIDVARTFVYLRTFRTDVISGAVGNLFPLLTELANRNSLSSEDILNCFPEEIVTGKYPDRKELEERQHIVVKGLNGKVYYICGDNAKGIISYLKTKYINTDKKIEIKNIVHGRTANQGVVVVGKAKILTTNDDLSKVNYGDIIVAHMTTPDFVPAMEKAAGFVTNEGGILCHAAIISREMDKPCIVGTINATSIFQDNDFVLLDADQGTARKISEEEYEKLKKERN